MACYRFKGLLCPFSHFTSFLASALKGVLGTFTVFTYFGRATKWYHQVIDSMFAARNVISPNKPERKRLASNASTLIILYLALQLGLTAALGLLKWYPLLVESPPARTEYLITCGYLLVMRISVLQRQARECYLACK